MPISVCAARWVRTDDAETLAGVKGEGIGIGSAGGAGHAVASTPHAHSSITAAYAILV